MSWKRALIYALAAGSVLAGLNISAIQYFMDEGTWTMILGTIIPFVIPALAIIAFLILTKKKTVQTVGLKRATNHDGTLCQKVQRPGIDDKKRIIIRSPLDFNFCNIRSYMDSIFH